MRANVVIVARERNMLGHGSSPPWCRCFAVSDHGLRWNVANSHVIVRRFECDASVCAFARDLPKLPTVPVIDPSNHAFFLKDRRRLRAYVKASAVKPVAGRDAEPGAPFSRRIRSFGGLILHEMTLLCGEFCLSRMDDLRMHARDGP